MSSTCQTCIRVVKCVFENLHRKNMNFFCPKIAVGVNEHQRPEVNYMWIYPTLICRSLRRKKGIVDPQHFAVLT